MEETLLHMLLFFKYLNQLSIKPKTKTRARTKLSSYIIQMTYYYYYIQKIRYGDP